MTSVAVFPPRQIDVSSGPHFPSYWPNRYAYYQEPTFYGTCTSVNSLGVLSNDCTPGSVAVSVYPNGCFCLDPATNWRGCGNTANGVCRLPLTSPVPVTPVPLVTALPTLVVK